MTPEQLDGLFPDRRAVIERDGGCNPALADLFIPAAVLLDLKDEQLEALTPNWRRFTRGLVQAVPSDLLETDEAQAS